MLFFLFDLLGFLIDVSMLWYTKNSFKVKDIWQERRKKGKRKRSQRPER